MFRQHEGILYLFPIGGGQLTTEKVPPAQLETLSRCAVYDPVAAKWSEWPLTAYRPGAKGAPINFAGGGLATIVSAGAGQELMITCVALTVDDETDITLFAGGNALSGPMDFGADGEPRGIVIPFSYSPLSCGLGGSFAVSSSDAVQVSGLVSYILIG